MSADVADRLIEMMKACKSQPASINELKTVTGWSRSSVWRWSKKLMDNGLIVEVPVHRPDERPRIRRKGFAISKNWGGA